jgi:hypothetical protein
VAAAALVHESDDGDYRDDRQNKEENAENNEQFR